MENQDCFENRGQWAERTISIIYGSRLLIVHQLNKAATSLVKVSLDLFSFAKGFTKINDQHESHTDPLPAFVTFMCL